MGQAVGVVNKVWIVLDNKSIDSIHNAIKHKNNSPQSLPTPLIKRFIFVNTQLVKTRVRRASYLIHQAVSYEYEYDLV